MRALWSDRPNCSHNVSQKVKRIRRVSDTGFLNRESGISKPMVCQTYVLRAGVANAPALYRGQNPQNREKRVSGSKNSHFPMPQKRAI